MLNRERGKNLLNGMMLIFAGFVIFVTSQSLPTFGKDYQMVFEVNLYGQNVSNDFTYIHAGSQGFSRFEFQSGNRSFIHIANVNAFQRYDIISDDLGTNWTCLTLPFNSTRGFGLNGLTGQNASLADAGILGYFFRGTGNTFNQIFNFAQNRTETYMGQTDLRGINADVYLSAYSGGYMNVVNGSREFYFSAATTAVNGLDTGRVPLRSVMRGLTSNGSAFYNSFEFVRFLPFLPPSWRQVEMFGDCFTQRNVANAALGDDDDDHHDDVKIPALPALPKDFKMMIEVNMYTHNTSWLASYWQFGNLSRVDYEYGGQFWTSIADNNANFRYEFPTSAASNCTQISLNSSFPFAGMGVANYTAGSMVANTWNITGNSTQLPPWQQSWSAVEDDDDDLPEILFFRLGVLRGTIYQLFMGGVTGVTAYKGGGVRNVRGIACNQWTKQITAHPWWPSLACNLTVDAFITAPTTEYFGVNATQVPVRFAIYGTINGTVFNHTYEVFGFTTYRPGAHEASFQFGSCSVQGQIYNALVAVAAGTVLNQVLINSGWGLVALALVIGVVIGILLGLLAFYFRRNPHRLPEVLGGKSSAPAGAQKIDEEQPSATEVHQEVSLDEDDEDQKK